MLQRIINRIGPECGHAEMRGTYRVFEPGDADHAHHDPAQHRAQPQQHELGGGVALVGGAVRRPAHRSRARPPRRDGVIADQPATG